MTTLAKQVSTDVDAVIAAHVAQHLAEHPPTPFTLEQAAVIRRTLSRRHAQREEEEAA